MKDIDPSQNYPSTRRIYKRPNRKKNLTDTSNFTLIYNLPLTTTLVTTTTTNATLIINSSSVPINDLFASISYFTKYKYFFLLGLLFLIFLSLITILFLIFIFKRTRTKNGNNRRNKRINKKDLKNIPDFLDDQNDYRGENAILLEPNHGINHSTNNNLTNGIISTDDISNTFSIDPMIEKKINENNHPNSKSLSPTADDTSLDTLRGSLISSPSQQISIYQHSSILDNTTTTDSIIRSDDRGPETEKDDDLPDLDLPRLVPRYAKATNNSSSNLQTHRGSIPSIEQSILRQQRRAEEEERGQLHGSNSNLYEKELRKLADREKFARKEQTASQASLVSRTSENSCY